MLAQHPRHRGVPAPSVARAFRYCALGGRQAALVVSFGIQWFVVLEVRQTEVYARWFRGLRDRQARAQIDVRVRRLSLGNPGDARPLGGGVSELRIDYGPGYRVYFCRRGRHLVVLLAGGDKDSQSRDVRRARGLADDLKEESL